jgi:cytochrome c-type biogenesis protein CcmH
VIAFVSIAAGMVVAALVWVLVPLLRGKPAAGVNREASNIAILRDQLADLDRDLANGTLSREQYDVARRDLEQRVLEESKAAPKPASGPPSGAGAYTAAVLGAALPIAAAVLYFALGSHEALGPAAKMTASAPADAQHDMSPEKISEMAASLAARLEKDPNNADGWAMLAHTYYSLKRFPEAVAAYERATALVPDNADLLADYADALAATSNTLDGKPAELVQRALKADPTQWKALALAGTIAFNRKDFKQAVAHWEQLRATLPPESEIARSIDASIAEAKDLGGIKTVAAAPSAPAGAASTATAPAAKAKDAPAAKSQRPSSPVVAGTSVSGTVTLAPALAKAAGPEDTVYVVARAAEGPRMPLAIMRKQVKDLPLTFSLDDSLAMSPEMKLSNFPEVVVGARVSKSGTATPQSGDLEGASKPIKVGTSGIAVVIDTTRP